MNYRKPDIIPKANRQPIVTAQLYHICKTLPWTAASKVSHHVLSTTQTTCFRPRPRGGRLPAARSHQIPEMKKPVLEASGTEKTYMQTISQHKNSRI